MSLQAGVVRSVRITFATTIVSALIQAGTLIALARLLTASDYGAMAAAMVFVRPVQAVLFSGMERALVLHSEDAAADSSTVWFSIGVGVLAAFGMILLGAVLFFTVDARTPGIVVWFVSPVFVIAGFNVPSRATLRRRLAFGKLGIADIVGQSVGLGAITIVTALMGWGAISLAAGFVTQALLQAALNLTSAPPALRGGFDRTRFAPLARQAFLLSKLSVSEVLHAQITPGFIGWQFGTSALGLFNRAYSLTQLPVEMLANSMSRVLLGGFATAKDDVERLRRGCRGLIQIGALATVPLCFGMAGARRELVEALLGPKWLAIVPIIPGIALGTGSYMLAHLFAVMNEAVGRSEQKFRIQVATSGLAIAGFLLLGHLGLGVCATIFGVSGVLFLAGQIALASNILQSGKRTVIAWLLPATGCGVLLYGYAQLVQAFLPADVYIVLTVQIAGCAILTPAIYVLFARDTLKAAAAYVRPGSR